MDDLKSTENSGQAAPPPAYAAQPDTAEAAKKRKRRLGLIIGLSVGIPVLVLATIFLVAFLTPSVIGMNEHVNDALTRANAGNIALAVNTYNMLNSDADPIDTKEELAAAAADGSDGVLGNLWPEGITDIDSALALIEFQNGTATVVTPAD